VILECKSGKKVIDRVTVEGETITYETYAASTIVESKVEILGHTKAIEQLRSWSNGYVTFSEILG
jgi:hypothetical protein